MVALASRANLVVDAVVAGGARLLRQPRRSAPPDAPTAASASEPRDAGIENFLVDLTGATGGSVIDGTSGSRLEGAFVAALREFRTRYQLSYTPTGVDRRRLASPRGAGAPSRCNDPRPPGVYAIVSATTPTWHPDSHPSSG